MTTPANPSGFINVVVGLSEASSFDPNAGDPLFDAVVAWDWDLDASDGLNQFDTPGVDVKPEANLMVIYTSGTTGLPKGINNNHFKLHATGIGVSSNMGLGQDDVGYTCMPLFHSNSMFVGLMPATLLKPDGMPPFHPKAAVVLAWSHHGMP